MSFKKLLKVVTVGGTVGAAVGGLAYVNRKQVEGITEKYNRTRAYLDVTNQWVSNQQNGKKLESYFKKNHISSIAIYGMGSLGELLYNELKDSDICVKCFVDRYAQVLSYGLDGLPLMLPEQMAETAAVDAVIVTPVHVFEQVEQTLKESGVQENIISLQTVVYEV